MKLVNIGNKKNSRTWILNVLKFKQFCVSRVVASHVEARLGAIIVLEHREAPEVIRLKRFIVSINVIYILAGEEDNFELKTILHYP